MSLAYVASTSFILLKKNFFIPAYWDIFKDVHSSIIYRICKYYETVQKSDIPPYLLTWIKPRVFAECKNQVKEYYVKYIIYI